MMIRVSFPTIRSTSRRDGGGGGDGDGDGGGTSRYR